MVKCELCTRECKQHPDKWIDGCCDYYAPISDYLDHLELIKHFKEGLNLFDITALQSWFEYSSHKVAAVNKKKIIKVSNFDGREKVVLPSGRCVKITLSVEYLGEFGVDYFGFP